jgi:hypothetical protein
VRLAAGHREPGVKRLCSGASKRLRAWYVKRSPGGLIWLNAGRRAPRLSRYGQIGGCNACYRVMTSDVITVDENATVQAAAQLMTEHRISALPVVDQNNRVIGMVSEGDLLHRAETLARSPSGGQQTPLFEGLLGLLAALRVARSRLPVRQVE